MSLKNLSTVRLMVSLVKPLYKFKTSGIVGLSFWWQQVSQEEVASQRDSRLKLGRTVHGFGGLWAAQVQGWWSADKFGGVQEAQWSLGPTHMCSFKDLC